MLTRVSPDRFRVDFGRVSRETGFRRLLELGRRSEVVMVDALAIRQALVAVMRECAFRDVNGAPQLWNEYRLFLAREDFDRIGPLEPRLQKDLGPALWQEIERQHATLVGDLVVRLLFDDADEVEPGTGVVHARHAPSGRETASVVGEMTVRLDKLAPPDPVGGAGPVKGTPTVRTGNVRVSTPAGELSVEEGVLYSLGRVLPDAGPDHLALPGADQRVNRRQLSLLVTGGEAEVTREPGGSNPVSVNGAPLPPGGQARQPLPVELNLSGGALIVRIEAC